MLLSGCLSHLVSHLGIPSGFPGATSVYSSTMHTVNDMHSVVIYEYQWDANQ